MKTNSVFNFLIRIPSFLYILIFLLISIVIGQINTLVFESITDVKVADQLSGEEIAIALIAAPILETLLFQTLIIETVCKLFKKPRYNFYFAIILSAVAFALNHTYNLQYVIFTFISGLVLSIAYYMARYRKENASIIVILIHFLYNLTSFIHEYLSIS